MPPFVISLTVLPFVRLARTGPGQWQATFPFPVAAVTTAQTPVLLSLTADGDIGASASISIPVNVATSP